MSLEPCHDSLSPRLIDRVLGAQSEGYERLMAFSGLGWALTLGLLEAGVAHPSFRMHAIIAPEWIWALIAGLSGLLHVIGLTTGRRALRLLACWVSVPLWWSVFALFAAEFPRTTAPAIYFVHALLGSWACVLLTGGFDGDSRHR
jgi:hypothetical protein